MKASDNDLLISIRCVESEIDSAIEKDGIIEDRDVSRIVEIHTPVDSAIRMRNGFLFRLFGNRELKKAMRGFGSFVDSVPDRIALHNGWYAAHSRNPAWCSSRPPKFVRHHDDLVDQITESISVIESYLSEDRFIERNEEDVIRMLVSSTTDITKTIGDSNKDVKRKISEFEHLLTSIQDRIEQHNESLAQSRMSFFKDIIPVVESRPLDPQQTYSAVYDLRNRLVVAGAGTGKTTTVVGLVEYLLKTGVKPESILLLSFTNASVDELHERIMKETGNEIRTSTFHKLGLDIISESNGKRPNISHTELRVFLGNTLNTLCQDGKYAAKLYDYSRITDIEDEDSETISTVIRTMKGETVKSHGEKMIADYLYMHNIPYTYEDQYQYETANGEFGQYYPDFHIKETDVYIEYFGINKEGNVNPRFKTKTGDPSEDYRQSMDWKIKLHKEKGTKLISVFFHQLCDGMLIDSLEEGLDTFGISHEDTDSDTMVHLMERDHTFQKFAMQFTTSITLLKSNGRTVQEFMNNHPRGSLGRFLELLSPLYDAYQEHLSTSGAIDFEDMLNLATDIVVKGRYIHGFDYVIVDEYQDISSSRYRLLKALRDSKEYHLFCVGDDWQSIYRFNGSDVGYIQDFERFWGDTKTCRIERTYRYSGKLLDASGEFVMTNPLQIRKSLSGPVDRNSFVKVINVNTSETVGNAIEKRLSYIPEGSSVLLLGRYNHDLGRIPNASIRNDPDGSVILIFASRNDLDIRFMTVHGSKGLQADYVFIINCRGGVMGFPNGNEESPLIPLLLQKPDPFPFAEERRLFYVAMTRARYGLYLVLEKGNVSPFVNEVLN